MTEPTDAEAWEMWLSQPLTGHASKLVGNFTRAAITKWGTPAPVGVEPVASVHRDTLAMLNSGQVRPWDDGARLYPASKARFDAAFVGVYTTLQPTPVGVEPVGEVGSMPGTDGFTMACFKASDVPIGTKLYTAEVPAMGRVPLTPEQIRAMLNKHQPDVCDWSYHMGIDDAELHHGIKGGQHG